MQLKILGSGTTAGETGRNCSGYLIDERFLFDCGPGIWSALYSKSKPAIPINHIFLSHFHVDHFADLIPFLWTRWVFELKNRQTLNIFGPVGLKEWFVKLVIVHREWVDELDIVLHELDQGEKEVDNYLVETLSTIHIENSICYRITDRHGKSIFYSGDSAWNDNLAILARSCDLAIIEASVLPEDQIEVHLTPQQAAQVAARAKVKTLMLTHLYPQVWPAGPSKIAAAYFSGEIIEAEDNMVINI